MDPLEWLKSLFREPTRQEQVDKAIQPSAPEWLRNLYKSPVADSLYQIAGVPDRLEGYKYTGPGTEYGYYNFGFDQLGINKDSSVYNPKNYPLFKDARNTLLHEMGHKATIKSSPAAYKPTNQLPFPASYYLKDTPEGKASNALDEYYVKSPMEAQAQAFRNAFNFLAETARDPKIDYRKLAGDMEANTPGMGLIIQDLMKLPIYAKHPLRGQIFRTEKKK